MNRLEDRYRRVLRVLPAWYRDAWEDDMVATFLQAADPTGTDHDGAAFAAEHGTPSWAEVGSVLALAVRLRLGGAGAPPRSIALGAALRRVAMVGLLLNAVTAVVGVASALWSVALVPRLTGPAVAVPAPGPWYWVPMLAGLLWVAAYVALVRDHRRAARGLAAVALVGSVVMYADGMISTGGEFAVSATYGLLFDALPVAALAAFHRDSPPVDRRPWLIAFPVGLAVVTVPFLPAAALGAPLDLPGLAAVLVILAAIVHLVGPGRRGVAWSVALAVLAVAVLGLRATSLVDYALHHAPGTPLDALLLVGGAQCAGLLAVALVLGVLARRELAALAPATAARPMR